VWSWAGKRGKLSGAVVGKSLGHGSPTSHPIAANFWQQTFLRAEGAAGKAVKRTG